MKTYTADDWAQGRVPWEDVIAAQVAGLAVPRVALAEGEIEVDFAEADELFDIDNLDAEGEVRFDTETLARIRQHRMLSIAQLLDQPPIQWFIEGLLPDVPRTVLHGKGGSKKSFLMLDWMLCAANGLQWQGRTVKPGRVLYIVGEGGAGIGKRIKAWARSRMPGTDPRQLETDFMAVPINLFRLKAAQVDAWAELVARFGYDYIVVDTLHTAMAGGDDSSSTDIGTVFENATRVAGDARLLFVHHDGNESKARGRGSSAIGDDADVLIGLRQASKLRSVLTANKLRDTDAFEPLGINFAVLGTGLDSSLYVDSVDSVDGDDFTPRPPTAAEACSAAIIEHGFDVSWGQVRMSDALKALDLGYTWGPSTVGKSLTMLRASATHHHTTTP